MIKNRRDISLLLCLVLLFSWFFPEIGSEAATSSELEQSIKEKGICDNGGTGAEKTASVHNVGYTGHGRQPGELQK